MEEVGCKCRRISTLNQMLFFHFQSCDEFASRRSTALKLTHSKMCVWVPFFFFFLLSPLLTPFTFCLSKRSRCTPFGFGWLLLALNFLLKRANREPCVCSAPQRQSQTLFLALWSSLVSRIIDLNDLIVGGKFKCAILITCYPRQIKSLCVKSTLFWITYKTSIYWINVGSNFILMWLTVCCSPLEWDKNTQTYNCVATLHLTCLFLLLSF